MAMTLVELDNIARTANWDMLFKDGKFYLIKADGEYLNAAWTFDFVSGTLTAV
jgi:hypothetical protein